MPDVSRQLPDFLGQMPLGVFAAKICEVLEGGGASPGGLLGRPLLGNLGEAMQIALGTAHKILAESLGTLAKSMWGLGHNFGALFGNCHE